MATKSILIVTHNIEEAVLMCDRILVFSSNPGRIISEVKVDLPQPRKRQDPRFRKLVDEIYTRMTQRGEGEGRRSDGTFPGVGIGMLLPQVSTNTMAGLMEALAGDPFNGRADLPELASALLYEADELFPVAETLQLMRFAELEGGDIKLNAAARRYVDADVDARKQLFRQHLLTYVPLAGYIHRELDKEQSHELPARQIREELEELMSPGYADQTLKSLVSWARYAEAFAYDENSELFTLETPE
jgi:NitT/TauT family transport system ATP-binding protein